MSKEAELWSFPTNPEEFDGDERISFSKLDNRYIAVQEDGTELEFDADLKRWVPIVDEALIQEHQSAYVVPDADSRESGSARQGRKRKQNDREDQDGRSKNSKRQQQPKQNTAVYVTGLPLDASVEEIHELFSRKCGVIAEEIDSGRPRIKMYTDAQGNFKGDALIVFFKPQSVDMAVMLLDDTDFRFNQSGTRTGKMRVQPADLSYKKTIYDDGHVHHGNSDKDAGNNSTWTADTTSSDAAPNDRQRPPQKQRDQEKQKIIRKTQKLRAKLSDWDDDDPSTIYPDSKSSRWDKVVILTHMFTLEELEEDPASLLEIKEDIREECEKLGPVTNVVLFDQEEDGIVSVKFQTPEAAEACVKVMHGRSFDGRTVEAYFATGRERFRRSKKSCGGEEVDEEGD
ncbi:hypothetical protein VTK73DRAFT_8891 [Phialemonium thermophilum]|uniref:RRM domain-containing protein n=1 Tax=Phialemonium thermophilum TaxID=223376 RepID=A0ABR3XM68_9PEZI